MGVFGCSTVRLCFELGPDSGATGLFNGSLCLASGLSKSSEIFFFLKYGKKKYGEKVRGNKYGKKTGKMIKKKNGEK
jgi:hypothetical protein